MAVLHLVLTGGGGDNARRPSGLQQRAVGFVGTGRGGSGHHGGCRVRLTPHNEVVDNVCPLHLLGRHPRAFHQRLG